MILPELDTHISRTQEKLPDLTSFNLSAISSDQNGCVTLSNMTKARVPLGVPKNTDNTDSSGTKTALPLSSRTTIMKGASQSSMSIAARVKARRNAARQNLAPRLSEESLSSRSTESYKSDSISSDGSESYRSDDADQTAGSLTIAGTSSDASEDGDRFVSDRDMESRDILLNGAHTTIDNDVGFVPFSYDSAQQPKTRACREEDGEPVGPMTIPTWD